MPQTRSVTTATLTLLGLLLLAGPVFVEPHFAFAQETGNAPEQNAPAPENSAPPQTINVTPPNFPAEANVPPQTSPASPQFSLLAGYSQPWRPQYHFTPPHNFMNDPNGLVFYKGNYNLFYQYNPQGNVWGHMSWGHANSGDMVHWRNQPVAIPEVPGKYMIYSGSAVVDWKNTSGLCHSKDPKDPSCLIAIFTAAAKDADGKEHQSQHIAVSHDAGRNWIEYPKNPVADLDAPDFRDPKVFWYEPQHKWVMVAVLADRRTAVLLDSPDLKQWTKRSTFGPAGDTEGQWECPDLFELPVEGSSEKKWVLIINRNPGAPAGGTGVRYFIGNFDGMKFTSEVPDSNKLWADYGKDFYATESFSDLPPSDRRRIWMGWIGNWQYANVEPTVLWRGADSIPRSLTLRKVGKQLLLAQQPIRELESLRGSQLEIANLELNAVTGWLQKTGFRSETYEIEVELQPEKSQEMGFRLRKSDLAETVVGIAPANHEVFIDRTHSGEVGFSKDFPGRQSAQVNDVHDVKLHIFVDRSSVEVFVNDGERVLTDRIYPPPDSDGIELYSEGAGGKVVSLKIWQLNSIWKQAANVTPSPVPQPQ